MVRLIRGKLLELRRASSRTLTRKRTALSLYVVLLVLPTLVLGTLLWHQLVQDQQERLAAVPLQVRDAASRLVDTVNARFQRLLERENRRGFEEYRWQFSPRKAVGAPIVFVHSPLASEEPPEGILSWFTYHLADGPEADYQLIRSPDHRDEEYDRIEPGLYASVGQLVQHDWEDGFFRRVTRLSDLHTEETPLPFVGVNASRERDVNCLIAANPELEELEEKRVLVRSFDFHLRFYFEGDGTPRIVATRPVNIQGDPAFEQMSDCFRELMDGETLMQGFFVDPAWLFHELPLACASGVLEGSMEFIPADAPLLARGRDLEVATIRPVEALDFETYAEEDLDYGSIQVAVSTRELRASFAAQTRRFLGVAAMLLLALGTGLALLLRSVRRELEQAERTENFVAAVTHELRTPVSAIRLYGEMLHDGWTVSADKQKEYFARIVSESMRLETMVERVLQKARLDSGGDEPVVVDLNECLRPTVEELVPRGRAAGNDLALELAPGLPGVLASPEAISSIVVNLVENARKYAPVAAGSSTNGASSEPILVRTRSQRGGAVVEVLDRGPGIPDHEKERVFDAFYRIGNEATRTSRGTGLGLHLVRAQAESMGGSAEVEDRPGGGSVFRVTLRAADKAS